MPKELLTHSSASTIPDRRITVVDRGFQLKYTFWLALIGGGVSVVCGGLMFLAYVKLRQSPSLPAAVQAELAQRDIKLLAILGAVSLLMTAVLGLAAIIITHRIAGPVYVMTRYLAVLAEGRYPSIRPLRKHDELKDVFALFQRSIEYIRSRDVEDAYRLGQAIERLRPVASRPEVMEAVALLRVMHARKREAMERPDTAPALGMSSPVQLYSRPDTRMN